MNPTFAREFPSFSGNPKPQTDRVAVILAGGDGTRLRSLTRAITGDERPKQFCPILDGETLLDITRRRVSAGIKPENTFFSLTKKHERFYARPLRNVPARQAIVQPENKGTAPAILYSLMRIGKFRPGAAVAFFPSDHYFSDDEAFMHSVDLAFDVALLDRNSVVLLGIEGEKAETSYGWIEASESLFGDLPHSVSRVKRFWEKPSKNLANQLMLKGSLWNSFVMVGRVETFLDLYEAYLPELYRMFESSLAEAERTGEAAVVRSLYTWLPETNFSSQVLEKATDQLLVMRVGDVGWSDLGEPQRVIGTLANLGIQPEWLQAAA